MRRKRGLSWNEVDANILSAAAEGAEKIVAAGGTRDFAEEAGAAALEKALDEAAPAMADRLIKTSPRILRGARRRRRAVRRIVRRRWGRALDLYMMCLEGSHEAGAAFDETHRPGNGVDRDLFVEALVGLHARACRTALEIHHLLTDGLPKGALARARTLHEIAVTAIVLREHRDDPEHQDLAERFLAHGVIATYKDAEHYQEHCETLGYEPFTEEEMADFRRDRDDALERYDTAFAGTYGWAAGLISRASPRFRDLEQLAELSHLRAHYSWASHEVHSDSKGWALNIEERKGVLYRDTSYADQGLADPASMALISLQQSTVSLLFCVDDVSPSALLSAKALQLLVDRAGDELVRAANDD